MLIEGSNFDDNVYKYQDHEILIFELLTSSIIVMFYAHISKIAYLQLEKDSELFHA